MHNEQEKQSDEKKESRETEGNHGNRKMRAFPSETSFEIKTEGSKDAVLEILKKSISDRSPLNPIPPDTPLRGGVYHSEFEAKEVVGYTYALLPLFRGRIEKGEHGTILRIKASNALTTVSIVWAWACSVGLFGAGLKMIFQPDRSGGILFMFVGLCCAATALFGVAFYEKKVEDGRELLNSLFTVKRQNHSKAEKTIKNEHS